VVFSSPVFLFIFLPIVLGSYGALFFLQKRSGDRAGLRMATNGFLLIASIVFYAWGEPLLTWVMIVSIVIDFTAGWVIESDYQRRGQEQRGPGTRSRLQKLTLVASLACNLGFLGVFKYFHFGVEACNRLMAALGLQAWQWHPLVQISLPIGISFYTFQSMSYTIDVYRGRTRGIRNFVDFACFVTMFPQLVAGPIVRYTEIASQLRQRTISRGDVAYGAGRFIVGLAKKVLVADTAAVAADAIFRVDAAALSAPSAWLGALAYTVQIYYDFSGYSDMAIGMGRALGFAFPENFLHPYGSRSITEFWRRWHVSLSTWFRDYLYVPLGGNRVSPARTALNLYLVFVLCGLWHGAGWPFLVWGLYHGTFLTLERGLGPRGPNVAGLALGDGRPLARGYTLTVVVFGWVIFRAATLSQALAYMAAMFGRHPAFTGELTWGVFASPQLLIAIVVGFAFSFPWWNRRLMGESPSRLREVVGAWPPAWGTLATASHAALLLALLTLSLAKVLAGTYSPFIYYRF
jgi:alginate O-acetyltransferase complex protein AlgI